jgi:hypothetical protein
MEKVGQLLRCPEAIETCSIDSTLECMLDKSSRRYGIRGGWVDAVVCLHVEDEVMGPDRDA